MSDLEFFEGYDEIFGVFKTAWDTTGFTAIYPNKKGKKPDDVTESYAKVFIQHSTGGQAAFGDGENLFEREGFFTAQVFVPIGQGLKGGMQLCKVIADAFEEGSSPRGVWFRNGRITEIGPDGEWYNVNFVTDFTYDERK